MATTKDAGWEPTRHGGLRRSQQRGAAQTMGTPEEASEQAEGTAVSGVEYGVGTGQYSEGHHSDKVKVGGSNPSPATWFKKFWGADDGSNPRGPRFIVKLNERLGLPSCPYVVRWRLETPWFSVRLHHWLAPDDDRARHDHPWSFTTFVLKGGYTDVSPSGDEHLRAPAVRHRKAEHQHTVVPDPGGAWTIIVTGPKTRTWGFWVKGRFVKSYRYFYRFGHHPCD